MKAYLTVCIEAGETCVIVLVILVCIDGIILAAAELSVRALHALRVIARELLDQNVGNRGDHGIDDLPPPQFLQESQMDVDEIPQPREHTLEIRLAQTEVTSQPLGEDLLHRDQHQAVVLLREYELVNVLLPLHLALAVVDEAQRDVAPDRRAP